MRHGAAMLVLTVVGAAVGCAGSLGARHPSSQLAPPVAEAWRALAAGRSAAAVDGFRARLAVDAHDPLALFGDASVAFERADNRRAAASYLALLQRAASRPDAFTPLLAAMAAGRLSVLLDEFGGSARDRTVLEDALLAVPLAALPWEAHYELAMVADRIARRRADPQLLARVAGRAGCLRTFTVARPAGVLPHLDLDAVASPGLGSGPAASDRKVETQGCSASLPSAGGRSGAQRVFAEIDIPAAGTYDVVLDFAGEARLLFGSRKALRHGDGNAYGPRVSSTRVSLAAGRHRLELRLAAFGGRSTVTVMVARTGAAATQEGPHPSPSLAAAPPDDPASARREPEASEPALVMARAYVASRLGDAPRAWSAAADLERARRFSIGLAVAALVARDDPSRPANLGRDRGRGLLREAVAIDPALARARHGLATIALEDDRPREALDEALVASRSATGWWMTDLTVHAAYRLRGLAWDADRALDRALANGPAACAVLQTALGRAEERRDVTGEQRLAERLPAACGRDSDDAIDRLRRRGQLEAAEAALRRLRALSPERDDLRMDLAAIALARGRASDAAALITPLVAADSRDGDRLLRLADALLAAGPSQRTTAQRLLARVLNAHPDVAELVRAARVLGVPLPLDPFRLDGRQVIRAFESSGRRYAAPAVVVLDRTVTRIFPSGAEMTLTHEIVRVQSKDALQKWGEIAVSERADILTLRTHKADGSTREPEEFAGKDTISAADLAIGDYVEKETIEVRPPRDAFVVPARDFAGGFLGDRFYFQSFDAPLDRSEYLLVSSREAAERMHVDARAGAPAAVRSAPAPAAAAGDDGGAPLVVTTFAAERVPQLFAERASVPAIEHVPSVRLTIAVDWASWARFVREQFYGSTRAAPVLARAAADIRALARSDDPVAKASALVAWVGQNVQAEDELRTSASFSVARGRGNRLAVLLALARELGLDAQPVLARSRLTADGDAPTPFEESDDFADPLVRFQLPGVAARENESIAPFPTIVYVDPRLKHAPLGYLPPGLDGARVVVLGSGLFELARGRSTDHRAVDMTVRLDAQGGGVAFATETVRGWPALEWAEIVDRFGSDRSKLRQDFEQRWLGVHFPGAVLKDLEIEIPGADGRAGTPYSAAEVRLRYSFSSTRLALKRERELRFVPTFFRSQPGRRYATEPRRGTTLMTGFEVPLALRARVELPEGARLIESQRGGAAPALPRGGEVARRGGYRFLEERRLESPTGAAPVLLLRRETRLPIMRVPLQDYPAVADELRRVDAMEQEEVRVGLGPERP